MDKYLKTDVETLDMDERWILESINRNGFWYPKSDPVRWARAIADLKDQHLIHYDNDMGGYVISTSNI